MVIRPAVETDLESADRVLRTAFGTQEGVEDPANYFGDRNMIKARWKGGTSLILVAEADSKIVGTAALTRWGSVGFIGRMAVDPWQQGKGYAASMMERAVELFDGWRVPLLGLDTFADSPKHIQLYQRFGFWPRFLNLMITKPVRTYAGESGSNRFSNLSRTEQQTALEEASALSDSIYPGLDPSAEIKAVFDQALGDTVMLRSGDELEGFAICHVGPGTEAGSGTCYIKFGGVGAGKDPGNAFARLIHACEALASSKGMAALATNVNAGRTDAYRTLLDDGFKPFYATVTMARPNVSSYDTKVAYVVDRWS